MQYNNEHVHSTIALQQSLEIKFQAAMSSHKQYLDKLKRKSLVENSIDFGTTRQFFGTDFRARSLNTLLQVLSKCSDHSTATYTSMHITSHMWKARTLQINNESTIQQMT